MWGRHLVCPTFSDTLLDAIRSEAAQGDRRSQRELGVHYLKEKRSADGVKWIEKAAEQGELGSQLLLGMLHMQGVIGVPKDESVSAQWI